MPTLHNEKLNRKNFTKRRTVEQGLQLADAAHAAVWRLYCEVFGLWRACSENSAAGIGAAWVSQPAVSCAACRRCRKREG